MKLISLFSGAGGLDLGFEKAGFEILVANEINPKFHDTYEYNFTKTILLKKSIKDITNNELPKDVDGIIGGPPCQSWSEAGSQRGIDDERGKLFYDYINVIKVVKPKFFLAENVSGLLHKKHQQAFANIIRTFDKVGYSVNYKMLDAYDYGVPQNRKRVFIVGIKKKLKKIFNFDNIKVSDKKYNLNSALKRLPKQIPAKIKNYTNGIYLDTKGIQNNEYFIGSFSTIYMSRNRTRVLNEPSFTIQAGGRHAPLHPSAKKMIKISKDKFVFDTNSKEVRRLSVRECARIQTFPDDFIFIYKNLADAYSMVGNAVPVKLSYDIAKVLRNFV
jgi:DNA (cytosine-5)-methyltransferase 1